MPIDFTCPHCGAHTNVAERYAGQEGPCATCGKPIAIPAIAPGESTPIAQPQREAAGAARKVFVVMGITSGAVLAAVVLLVAIIAIVAPVMTAARSRASMGQCNDNLARIGAAMLAYHNSYGEFPPAYVADANGRPMHSWRVLLLPFLGPQELALYESYDLSQPWDSPQNLNVLSAANAPSAYQCPADPNLTGLETSYRVVVGRGMVFQGTSSASLDEIEATDPPAVLVVEVRSTGVLWFEPADLKFDRIGYGINADRPDDISSHHPGGVHAVFSDGSVSFLDNSLSQEELRAMLSVRDGS